MFASLLLISSIVIVVSGPALAATSYYGYTGGHYSILTRGKYSSSFQKVYRPSPLSYHQPQVYLRRPQPQIYRYNPQSYQYRPPYYTFQPYTQSHYYNNNSGKLFSWLESIKYSSDRTSTTTTTTTTTTTSTERSSMSSTTTESDEFKIKRKKKNFNFRMTASKSLVSESHTVTVSTSTSVVTSISSISSTVSVKQLGRTTSGDLSTTAPDVTTEESVFLVYPAVDDSGIDDGLRSDPRLETTVRPVTMRSRGLEENRNVFGLLSQLNNTVSSLCKYSLVARICTMRNIMP